VEPETDPVTDASSSVYADKSMPAPPYTIEIFEDVGRAFCIALLDWFDKNPVTRITSSSLKSLDGVKNELINMHKILIPRKPIIKT
jgi:hypothetical protein